MVADPDNARAVSLLFRAWSRVYDNRLPQQLFYRRVHDRILRRWEPRRGERVLDVGCGTGLFLKSLAQRYDGLALTGLDLSEPMLSRARRDARAARSPAPTFVQGSVYEMPFADGSFDVVLNTISCHFYLEQVRAFREYPPRPRALGPILLRSAHDGPARAPLARPDRRVPPAGRAR